MTEPQDHNKDRCLHMRAYEKPGGDVRADDSGGGRATYQYDMDRVRGTIPKTECLFLKTALICAAGIAVVAIVIRVAVTR